MAVEDKVRTILFVDDDEFLCDLGKEMLERSGYEVVVARSGNEGLETYRSSFGLIVSDVDMPGMNGIKMYKKIIEVDPNAPKILFLSGNSYTHEPVVNQLGDRARLISKPYQVAALIDAVNAMFRQ